MFGFHDLHTLGIQSFRNVICTGAEAIEEVKNERDYSLDGAPMQNGCRAVVTLSTFDCTKDWTRHPLHRVSPCPSSAYLRATCMEGRGVMLHTSSRVQESFNTNLQGGRRLVRSLEKTSVSWHLLRLPSRAALNGGAKRGVAYLDRTRLVLVDCDSQAIVTSNVYPGVGGPTIVATGRPANANSSPLRQSRALGASATKPARPASASASSRR